MVGFHFGRFVTATVTFVLVVVAAAAFFLALTDPEALGAMLP